MPAFKPKDLDMRILLNCSFNNESGQYVFSDYTVEDDMKEDTNSFISDFNDRFKDLKISKDDTDENNMKRIIRYLNWVNWLYSNKEKTSLYQYYNTSEDTSIPNTTYSIINQEGVIAKLTEAEKKLLENIKDVKFNYEKPNSDKIGDEYEEEKKKYNENEEKVNRFKEACVGEAQVQYPTIKSQYEKVKKYSEIVKAVRDSINEYIKKFIDLPTGYRVEIPRAGWLSDNGNPAKYIWIKIKDPCDKSNHSISVFFKPEPKDNNDDPIIEVCLELTSSKSNKAGDIDREKNKVLYDKYNSSLEEGFSFRKIIDDKGKQYFRLSRYSIRNLKELGESIQGNTIQDKIKKYIESLGKYYMEVKRTNPIHEKIMQQIKNGYKQIVLTGAPGTGKTFSALEYAAKVNEGIEEEGYFAQFHPSYDYTDFVEGIRPVQVDKIVGSDTTHEMSFVKMDGNFKRFCRIVAQKNLDFKLNPDSNYLKKADVIFYIEKYQKNMGFDILGDNEPSDEEKEGIKDYIKQNTKEDIEYETIKEYYKCYKEKLGHDYCFVIDEINRADISKVFGELMFLLEYRGVINRKPTQYHNLVAYHKKDENSKVIEAYKDGEDCFEKGFFIPENVVIIGTMNDIDKSVESFDYAMRRRFKWPEVEVDKDFLKNVLTSMLCSGKDEDYSKQIDKLAERIVGMNEEISNQFSSAYCIGPAYFKDYKLNTEKPSDINEESLQEIWDNSITSILEEYSRGRKGIDNKLNENCSKKLKVNNKKGK